MRNVGGLARPGRDRAEARHHRDLERRLLAHFRALLRRRFLARTVSQQSLEQREFTRVERALDIGEVDEARRDGADTGMDGFERGAQFCDAEIGNCGGAEELNHGGRAFYRMRNGDIPHFGLSQTQEHDAALRSASPFVQRNEECPFATSLAPGSPPAGVYMDIGNGATLLPSNALILACPCFFTSSMRRMECIGSMVHLTPVNSDLMRSSPGSRTTRGTLAEDQLFHLDESEQPALADLTGINLVNLALVHEHNLENVTGCHREE